MSSLLFFSLFLLLLTAFSPRGHAMQSRASTRASDNFPSTNSVIRTPSPIRRSLYMEVLLRDELRSLAFGRQAWQQCFGVDVVEESAFPSDIVKILDAQAPFLLTGETSPQRIRDNHLLTLIPSSVCLPDGTSVPFTLDCLGDLLLQNYGNNDYLRAFEEHNNEVLGFNSHGYGYYSPHLTLENRQQGLSGSSYWILLSKTVLHNSQNMSFVDQQMLMPEGYRVPRALEVAVSLVGHYARSAGKLPAGQQTHSRCLDINRNKHTVVAGLSERLTLDIYSDDADSEGVSCCMQLH